MIRRLLALALLLSLLITPAGRAQTPPASVAFGCLVTTPTTGDNGPWIQRMIAQAATTGARCLVLAAGVYPLQAPTTQGAILTPPVPGMDISGPGAVLRWQDDARYPDGFTNLFQITQADIAIHDLTIAGGADPGGPGNWTAVNCTLGCLRGHFYNLDISGVYGTAPAGGDGIGVYSPWDQDGDNGALVEHNYIHDSPNATGLDISGDNNRVRDNRVERMGNRFTAHGIYLSGGKGNVFTGNRIVDAAGYCFAAHEQAPEHHAGGNVFAQNECLNYHAGAIVVDGLESTGINPAVPAGRNLTDSFLIDGNYIHQEPGFALTNGIGIWVNGVTGVVITNNTLQDASSDTYIDTHLATAARILDNRLSTLTGPNAGSAIFAGPGTLVQGNVFDALRAGYAIQALDGVSVIGNYFALAPDTSGVQIAGNGGAVANNTILTAHWGQPVQIGANRQGWALRDNTLGADGGIVLRVDAETPNVGGAITGNRVVSGTVSLFGAALTGVTFADNPGLTAITTTAPLVALPVVGDADAGRLVAWQAGGVGLATGSSFAGLVAQQTYAWMGASLFVTQPGAVVAGACVSGPAPVGDVAVPNGAGCLVDSGGAVPPPAGGWARIVPSGVELHPDGGGNPATPTASATPTEAPTPTPTPTATPALPTAVPTDLPAPVGTGAPIGAPTRTPRKPVPTATPIPYQTLPPATIVEPPPSYTPEGQP